MKTLNPKHIAFIAFVIILCGLTYGVFFAFNTYIGALIIILTIAIFLFLIGMVIEAVEKYEDDDK